MTGDQKNKKLEQVRKILDLAAGERKLGHDEAAENYEKRADDIMVTYMIDEAMLAMSRPADERERPEVRSFNVYMKNIEFEVNQMLLGVLHSFARSVGCIIGGGTWEDYKIVGWARDLDYLEMLYTQIQLHLALKINPRGDSDLTFDENVVMLKEAGLKWEEVYRRMRDAGFFPDDPEWVRRIGVKFTGIYTNYCKKHNLPRQYASPSVYRRSFIEGYEMRLRERAREMKEARTEAGSGHEIVLHNLEDDLLEFVYEIYPERRPHPEGCDCDECHRCNDPKCIRPRCKAARQPIKFSRGRRYVEPKMDRSAMNAGRSAANTVDISRESRVGGGGTKKLT